MTHTDDPKPRFRMRLIATPEEFLDATCITEHYVPPKNGAGDAVADIDLSPLRDGQIVPPRLPLELLGPIAPWIEDASEAANSPADYVTASLLGAASGAIGNSRWAKGWGTWVEPPVQWWAAVGKPSSGKSPAAKVVQAALRRIEAEEFALFEPELDLYEAARERAEAALAQWKERVKDCAKSDREAPAKPAAAKIPREPMAPRLVVKDITPEALASVLAANPRGLLTVRDELSGWFKGMDRYSGGGAERSFWIEAYGGEAHPVDRKTARPFIVPHLSVAIYGGMQPDHFANLVTHAADDGLAARFLWVWPSRRPFARPTRDVDVEVAYRVLKRLRSLAMARTEEGLAPVLIEGSAAALERLAVWSRAQDDAPDHGGTLMCSWRGKARGHVLRLALVLEFLDWAFDGGRPEPAKIGDDAMRRAIEFYTSYLEPMARRVFGDAALPESHRDAGAVAKWIVQTRATSFKMRDVYRNRVGGITDAARAQRALETLCDAGWIAEAAVPFRPTGGRRTEIFNVNPGLWLALQAR